MASVSTYLNFPNNTEEAFEFYRCVFGGEFLGGISRFGDVPDSEDMAPMSDEDKNLIMNIQLMLPGGHRLMGTDAPEFMGFTVNPGNNFNISLHPDSRDQADEWFTKLSAGGEIESPMEDVFWGAYYGSFTDKFGIHWMIHFDPNDPYAN